MITPQFFDQIPAFQAFLNENQSNSRSEKAKKSAIVNYISWMKYLSWKYPIDPSMTEQTKKEIIANLKETANLRDKYKSTRDYGNFSTALNKYLEFLRSPYASLNQNDIEDHEEDALKEMDIPITEKTALIKARRGQGQFRTQLIEYWHGCAISGLKNPELLIASHIKPWYIADNQERLNVYNGLLLLPNYDKLFDRGYISFDNNGKIIISQSLTREEADGMHITDSLHLISVAPRHKKFLEYHRQKVLI